MNELCPEGAGRQRHRLGPEGVHRVEALPSGLVQNADQIDDNVGVARRGLDRARIAQVGGDRVDLADAPERLQMAGKVGPAHRHPYPVAASAECPDHMAAEETRAAEHGDQLVDVGLGDHAQSSWAVILGRPPGRRRAMAPRTVPAIGLEYSIRSRAYRGFAPWPRISRLIGRRRQRI
jgi:hypothetical protein